MRIETIEEFIIFSKHLNISNAAKEANVSQPSFSEHMASMENEIGVELINRSGKTLSLTASGEEFLKYAQIVLGKYREGVSQAREMKAEGKQVRICTNFPIYPKILSFLMAHGINIKVLEIGFNSSPLECLVQKRADLGFAIDLTKSERFSKEMQKFELESFIVNVGDPLSLSMSKDHPLASKAFLTKDDLQNMTLLSNIGYLYDAYKANILDALGEDFPVEVRLEPISSMSDLAFSELGDGIHICGRDTFDRYQSHRDDIVIFDKIEGVDFIMPTTCLYRKDETDRSVLSAIAALKDFSD